MEEKYILKYVNRPKQGKLHERKGNKNLIRDIIGSYGKFSE